MSTQFIPRELNGGPSLFPKAYWIFSTTTCPLKHNLSFSKSSIQRVFLTSKLPSLPTEQSFQNKEKYRLYMWAPRLKTDQGNIFQLQKCRPLELNKPGVLQKYCCEKKRRGQEKIEKRRRKEEMDRQSSCQTQRLLFEKHLHGKDSLLHTKNWGEKIISYTNAAIRLNYQRSGENRDSS